MEHQLELELQRVQRALKRVSGKKYGLCLVCGKEIQAERLKIYPEAEYCIDCQKKRKTN
jgi:DnaK suppressor protein